MVDTVVDTVSVGLVVVGFGALVFVAVACMGCARGTVVHFSDTVGVDVTVGGPVGCPVGPGS